MLTPALYVLALFLSLSLVVGVLVAVHDGIEYLLARRARAAGGPATGNRGTGRAARSATASATAGATAAARASSGRAVRARDLVVVSTESGLAPAVVYQAGAYQDRTGRERPTQRAARAADRGTRNRGTVQGETAAREIPPREAARLLRNSSGR